jgi:hypothetical protein
LSRQGESITDPKSSTIAHLRWGDEAEGGGIGDELGAFQEHYGRGDQVQAITAPCAPQADITVNLMRTATNHPTKELIAGDAKKYGIGSGEQAHRAGIHPH